ncbi:MAG: hypothetical protein K8S00_01660 [Bacteroidales bacterium]|nr:hypothetical protein [Bacteroidales bacterium]
MLIPALRNDKNGFDDLFGNKRIRKEVRKKRVEFYNSNIKYTANWDLIDNSKWFKQNFISELQTQNSVLRSNIKSISQPELSKLIQKIEETESLSREVIESNIKQFKLNERKSILNFRELLYHISGARVMDCESLIPQEEYIDYSLTDIEKRNTILSEYQIFNKLFLALAAESIKLKITKLDLFDYLEFEDILIIRQIIDNNNFRSHYQSFLRIIIEGFHKEKPDEILYNHQEIIRLQQILRSEFKDKIDNELDDFLAKMEKKRKLKSGLALGKGTVSIALGIASFIDPLYTLVGIVKDSPSTIVNITDLSSSKTELDRKKNYVEMRKNLLSKILDRKDFRDETILLDMVSLLSNYVSNDLKVNN